MPSEQKQTFLPQHMTDMLKTNVFTSMNASHAKTNVLKMAHDSHAETNLFTPDA
jgi:hypothetical protein